MTEKETTAMATTKNEFTVGQIVDLELSDCVITAVYEDGLIDVQFGGTTLRQLDPDGWDAVVRRTGAATR